MQGLEETLGNASGFPAVPAPAGFYFTRPPVPPMGFREGAGMDGVLGIAAAALGGLAQLASIGSAFWLGGRLLRRAQHGGGAPERLLGLHLLLAIGVGSLLLSAATLSAYTAEPLPPLVFRALTVGGNLATILGLTAVLWFNSRVFHGGQLGGRLVAVISSLLMCAGFAQYVAAGGMETAELYGRASWPYVGAMVLGDLWVTTDALRFRAQLLRRLALGLADPLVVDRLLLWAIGSAARVGLVLIAPLVTAFVPSQELRMALAPGLLLCSALLILAATVSLWLMLAPSPSYRRWVARRHAPAR